MYFNKLSKLNLCQLHIDWSSFAESGFSAVFLHTTNRPILKLLNPQDYIQPNDNGIASQKTHGRRALVAHASQSPLPRHFNCTVTKSDLCASRSTSGANAWQQIRLPARTAHRTTAFAKRPRARTPCDRELSIKHAKGTQLMYSIAYPNASRATTAWEYRMHNALDLCIIGMWEAHTRLCVCVRVCACDLMLSAYSKVNAWQMQRRVVNDSITGLLWRIRCECARARVSVFAVIMRVNALSEGRQITRGNKHKYTGRHERARANGVGVLTGTLFGRICSHLSCWYEYQITILIICRWQVHTVKYNERCFMWDMSIK